ncbi:MAG TPA: family 20 glycosylhydrolase [Chitinophagaceae bacterium]|nr:family 20 glycosylhydrolase [Chitinophagaceae bacterium]
MKRILFPVLLFVSIVSFSQKANEINIIPRPVYIKVNTGSFALDRKTCILNQDKKAADLLNNYLKTLYGFTLPIKKDVQKDEKYIFFSSVHAESRYPNEGYGLKISKNKIEISSKTETGAFYGIQTLLQLLPANKNSPLSIPQLSIWDYPRFPYRGMHLDVGRHFFPAPVIKKYIDYLAYHKFNTFHWHLTEDQGWRIEIKKYPKLTSVGGYRNGTIIGRNPGKGNTNTSYGGFYTQEEIKDIVNYAADRNITVIPEIELPGHSSAAIAAYPELSCFPNEPTKIPANITWNGSREGKQVPQSWGVFEDVFCPSEFTFNFLEGVLDEVMQLFPSKYIHIGGDECPKTNWKRSEFCQNLIKEKNLKDEHGLQSYFIQRIEKYLNSKGRNIIGWDEILEGGLAPNATVMSWRGEEGGIAAAKEKHNVIMTPEAYCYLNFSQTRNEDSLTYPGYLPLEKVYNYEPLPKELNAEQAKFILGTQGNVWTEYINNPKLLEYQVLPRMSALSEVLWSPKEKRNLEDFERRLPAMYKRYEQWGASYNMAQYDLQSYVLPSPNDDGVLWKLETRQKGKIIYTKGRTRSMTFNYSQPILIKQSGEYVAILTDENHKLKGTWLSQKFSVNKATGKKITLKEPPAERWKGNGAFTLVNGIITEKKLDQATEWLGFSGKDLEAIIDLGKDVTINTIRLHVLKQENSWIYLPAYVEFFTSNDGINFSLLSRQTPGANDERTMETHFTNVSPKINTLSARYIKIFAKNAGTIPEGKRGAGNPAWLLADEIEVE